MNTLTGRVGGAVGPMIGSGWNYKNIVIAMTTTVQYYRLVYQSITQADDHSRVYISAHAPHFMARLDTEAKGSSGFIELY